MQRQGEHRGRGTTRICVCSFATLLNHCGLGKMHENVKQRARRMTYSYGNAICPCTNTNQLLQRQRKTKRAHSAMMFVCVKVCVYVKCKKISTLRNMRHVSAPSDHIFVALCRRRDHSGKFSELDSFTAKYTIYIYIYKRDCVFRPNALLNRF